MSRIGSYIANISFKGLLKIIPVSERGLLNSGFLRVGDDYHMANLIIFGGDGYYYYDLRGERVSIRSMKAVSDLVFGLTPFLDMTNG